MLNRCGPSGNSFWDYRHKQAEETKHDPLTKIGEGVEWLKDKVDGDEGQAANVNDTEISMDQKYHKLVWGEGPTGGLHSVVVFHDIDTPAAGPRDKSLDRKGMNRGSDVVADSI